MTRLLLGLLAVLLPGMTLAQANPAARAARQWRQQREPTLLAM